MAVGQFEFQTDPLPPACFAPVRAVIVPRWRGCASYFTLAAFSGRAASSCTARDRWFESISLQRRVRLSPGAAFGGREPRLSARLCAAGLATGSAETCRVLQDRANRRQYLCRAIFQYRSAADGVGENAHAAPNQVGAFAELDRAVDRCARTGLNQSPARSADRARQAAGVSARGASLASDRAAAAHRGSPG